MKKELVSFRDPKSPIAEIFRTLRTNIQFMDQNKTSKTILITSTYQGEGKSWISANLAITFAQTGKRIILVDSDMRRGRQYSIFGVYVKPGLSNYLTAANSYDELEENRNIANYIQKTRVANLDILTAGSVPQNPSELLETVQMEETLQNLKSMYDIVIIDGTPCQLVADSLILARIVDSTIIVAAHKETKKKELQRVATNIRNVGGNIFGVVLNKKPKEPKKYEYSYYYSANNRKTKM